MFLLPEFFAVSLSNSDSTFKIWLGLRLKGRANIISRSWLSNWDLKLEFEGLFPKPLPYRE